MCLWLLASMFVFKHLGDYGSKDLSNIITKVSVATVVGPPQRLVSDSGFRLCSHHPQLSKDLSVKEAEQHLLQNL